MSEMTPCNFCTLRRIKARNKGKKVELQSALGSLGGYDVYIDGEKSGTWFMAVTDHCVC
jgi:hypothetical protein